MADKPQKGRIKELLIKCADNLDNGCEAMHHQFLLENNVSADECFTLGQQMAVAVRGYAQAPTDLALKIVMAAEFKDEKERDLILTNLDRAMTQKRVIEQLKKI